MRAPVEAKNPLVHGPKAKVREAVISTVGRAGFRIERLEDTSQFIDDDSTKTPELMNTAYDIPGMVSMRRGMFYYWLAYAGGPGDVVEIGCWQGRSTVFLAQACADAQNGVVHSVDTFGGNPGHEDNYVVGASDLSDLEANFRANVDAAGLGDQVRVYPGRSEDRAAEVLAEVQGGVRLLVIDADHTYEAVSTELSLYADAVNVGGVLAFDDYQKLFPGVAEAINEHLAAHPGRYARPAQDEGLLVVRRVS